MSELERFHELAETLDAIFWEADPQTLSFTFLSRRAALILGEETDAAQPLPQRWGDHIDPDDRAPMTATLRRAVETPGDDLDLEYRTRGREGETLWLRDIVHVAADARGRSVVRGLIVDVTERKRAEQALRRSEQKYSEAFHREREATQRLRALDEMKNTFLEAVSHDLRTPLTSILGRRSRSSDREWTSPGRTRSTCCSGSPRTHANSNASSATCWTSTVSSGDHHAAAQADRRRCARRRGRPRVRAVRWPRGAVRVGRAHGGRRPPEGRADRREPALERGSAHHPESRIWARVDRRDDGILLVVEDEGGGVPDQLKDAIFEPFRQGPGPASASPGVGVGLSLVARFAELHGGRAWVEDRPGGGASFKVLLPEA